MKVFCIVLAVLFSVISVTSVAYPKDTHLVGRVVLHHKGSTCR